MKRSEVGFVKEDLDPFWEKYHIGCDAFGKPLVYKMFNGTIPFIVNAEEFNEACKKFAKDYFKGTCLVDEDTGKFIKRKKHEKK